MSDASAPLTPARADARRNRRRLLDAAIDLVLELGGEPTRDAVAKRAGVGIATLYRHFPDQQSLLRAVLLDVLDRTIAAGNEALDSSDEDDDALRAYLHAAVDIGLGAVNIIHPLLESTDWPEHTAAAQEMLDRLVGAARETGVIAGDVSASDISFVAIRFCRPLSVGLDPAEERAITHRQLDVHLDGLRGR